MHFSKLVTGEVIKQCNGSTAIHTSLGRVLFPTHALKVDGYQLQESLDSQLKRFLDLESTRIQSEEHSEFKKCISYKWLKVQS